MLVSEHETGLKSGLCFTGGMLFSSVVSHTAKFSWDSLIWEKKGYYTDLFNNNKQLIADVRLFLVFNSTFSLSTLNIFRLQNF